MSGKSFACLKMVPALVLAAQLASCAESIRQAAWNVLNAGLSDKNPDKRRQALTALDAAPHDPQAIQALEQALTDKDLDVRQAAAATLGSIKSRASIPKLKTLLEDPDPIVEFTAAKALWAMGDHSGEGIFLQVLGGEMKENEWLKGSMRQARAKLRNPSALALMGVKEGAGMLLGPFAMGIPIWEELRKDGGAAARAACAAQLAADPSPEATSALVDALNDKSWAVRAAAARALAERKNVSAISPLQDRFEDKQEGVRYVAAAAVIRLTGPPSPGRHKNLKPARSSGQSSE